MKAVQLATWRKMIGVKSPLHSLINSLIPHSPYEERMMIHLAMVHKRRGNPNWGKPLPSSPAVPTEFEGVALRLGLTKETYSSSGQLRVWCERNGNRCYVPEWLLKEWGIIPDLGWS
jgi:hypothetical protein